jgi:hypothetical protein
METIGRPKVSSSDAALDDEDIAARCPYYGKNHSQDAPDGGVICFEFRLPVIRAA